MSDIKERLDKVRALIQESEFLEGKGLSNEVNIRIFCYEPENEMVVRHFVNQLETDQSLDCHLIVCNLYKTFLSICDDMDITDAIPDMEEADGSAYLLEQLNSAIGNGEFIDKIQYEPHEPGDVLMLTGVGEVFPFMRIHTLLEALQPYFSDVPILVMYPGEFDGRHVKLFNRLTPNDYYRAFNVIDIKGDKVMMIRDMFADDINRKINGVIKVDQAADDVIEQELNEYVITRELKKHFITFFNYYGDAFDQPTADMGVWISGFFGSGKSHFLKMLSYLLENKEVKGIRSVERFRKKFEDDPATFMLIDRATKGQTETILFNIDIEGFSNKDKTAVLRVFAKMFYNHWDFTEKI